MLIIIVCKGEEKKLVKSTNTRATIIKINTFVRPVHLDLELISPPMVRPPEKYNGYDNITTSSWRRLNELNPL